MAEQSIPQVTEEEARVELTNQVNGYFQFKKNLLIQEIVCYKRNALEIPDIICILMAECVYNVHTDKLIISGGTPEGFYEKIKTRYQIDSKLDKRIRILAEGLSFLLSRNLIEFIPDGDAAISFLEKIVESPEVEKEIDAHLNRG